MMWLLEQLFQDGLKWLIEQVGQPGDIALFLIVGFSLLVGCPPYMSRENRRRRREERRPRYGWLEYGIIVIGGFVAVAIGVAMLVTSN